jgi:hypothetical protein
LREKVVAAWRPDEGYCEASLARVAPRRTIEVSLRDTPHRTLADARATFSR